MALWKDQYGREQNTPDAAPDKPAAATPVSIETARQQPAAAAQPRGEAKESLLAAGLTIEGKIEGTGHVRIAGGGEARRPGAHAHVTVPARDQQVVIEGRDPVHGRLGQPGALRRDPPVVVGDLAASIHRLFEDFERGRRSLPVVATDQFHQIARHGANRRVMGRNCPSAGTNALIDAVDRCSSASSNI